MFFSRELDPKTEQHIMHKEIDSMTAQLKGVIENIENFNTKYQTRLRGLVNTIVARYDKIKELYKGHRLINWDARYEKLFREKIAQIEGCLRNWNHQTHHQMKVHLDNHVTELAKEIITVQFGSQFDLEDDEIRRQYEIILACIKAILNIEAEEYHVERFLEEVERLVA